MTLNWCVTLIPKEQELFLKVYFCLCTVYSAVFQTSKVWGRYRLLNMSLFPCLSHCKREGDVPLSYIVDQENRTMWINEKLNLAKSQFMDGINIDIEQVVAEGSPEYHALTALVNETTEAFHREIPGSQVPWLGSLVVVLKPLTWQ